MARIVISENDMKSYLKNMLLLCMCLLTFVAHAQEKSDLKGTSCIPVRSLAEEDLAFKAGEQMEFLLHYQWGKVNTDVGTAVVTLDSLTFNGEKAFLSSALSMAAQSVPMIFTPRSNRG